MAEQEIQIILGTDASKFETELLKATNTLKKFESALKKATDVNEINYLQKNIGLIKKSIDELQNSQTKFTAGASKANYALTNLSRVASDAPFGFIAIQNNLQPLIESFGQLKQETGTVGGALKALGSNLLGPAGLGVAFSVISAGVLFWQESQRKANKETEKTNELIKTSADIIAQAEGNTRGQIIEIQTLTKIITNETLSQNERLKAYGKLKDINPELVKGINLQSDSLKILTARTEEYTKSLAAEAVLNAFKNEVGNIAVEINKKDSAIKSAIIDLDKLKQKEEQIKRAPSAAAGSVASGGADVQSSSEIRRAVTDRKDKELQINNLKSERLQLANRELDLNKSLEESIQNALKFYKESSKSGSGSSNERITILEKEYKAAQFNTIALTELAQARRNALLDTTGVDKVLSGYTDKLASQRDVYKDVANNIKNIGKALKNTAETQKEFIEQSKFDKIKDFLINELSPAFTTLFDNILSGSKNALQAFGQAIAGVIKKLIAAAITAAIFAAIVSVAFPGSAAGGASFAKNFIPLFGQLSGLKFADGGIVSGPTRALIGEAGPEAVIPLHKLDSMIGGNQNIFVTGVLSGENIYLQQQRTSARRSRFV